MLKQAQIRDSTLRNFLIRSAMTLETMLQSGRISTTTPIQTTKWCGLMVMTTIERKGSKPPIFRYSYRMNHKVTKDFFAQNKHLFEGVLVFECCGVRFFIPALKNRFKRAAYEIYLDEDAREKVDLCLWDRPVNFLVHRDVISDQEWCVFLEDPNEGYLAEEMAQEMGGA